MSPRRSIVVLRLALASCAIVASACAARGRDVGNKNPRSVFEDGPGGVAQSDGGVDKGGRVLAEPSPSGVKPRLVAHANARAIVTDATRIYFGDAEDDALYAVAKTGGEKVKIARRAPMPGGLAIDDGTLAWIGTPGDVVFRAPAAGGNPTTVRDRSIFTDVAASGGDVLLTEASGAGGHVTRITGSTAARIATFSGSPRGLTTDAMRAYVATTTSLLSVPHNRGEIATLATGTAFASPQVDTHSLYATTFVDRSRVVIRVDKDSGGETTVLARDVRDAPIALHRGTLYWFDASRPALLAASSAGGEPRVVALDPLLDGAAAIAVDDDGIYVTAGDGENGRVLALPKDAVKPSPAPATRSRDR